MYIDHKFQSRVKPNHIFKCHLLINTINYCSNPIHICVPFITKHSDTKLITKHSDTKLNYPHPLIGCEILMRLRGVHIHVHLVLSLLSCELAWREKYDAESHSVVLELDRYESDTTLWSQPDGGYPLLTILPVTHSRFYVECPYAVIIAESVIKFTFAQAKHGFVYTSPNYRTNNETDSVL